MIPQIRDWYKSMQPRQQQAFVAFCMVLIVMVGGFVVLAAGGELRMGAKPVRWWH